MRNTFFSASSVKGVVPDIDKAERNYLDQCPQKEERKKNKH